MGSWGLGGREVGEEGVGWGVGGFVEIVKTKDG